MRGSLQLRKFLRDIRAGMPVTEAAERADMSIGEAVLHVEANEAGEYSDIDTTTAPVTGAFQQETTMPKHDDVTALPTPDDDPLIELAAETLRGDIRDSLLAWFKAAPKAWPYMDERSQRDLADAADRYSRQLIKDACKIIAAGERPCIVAKLVEYKEKDGVEAKLKLPSKGEVVASLHEACGREVLLVTSGAEEYMEQAGDPEIDADQPKFPNIGEEYDDAA